MEYGDRIARVEADVATLKTETLRLRDGHSQIERQVQALTTAAAIVSAEVRAFIAAAEVQAEQIAYRVYNRIKSEERERGNDSMLSGTLSKALLGLVAVVGTLLSFYATGKL